MSFASQQLIAICLTLIGRAYTLLARNSVIADKPPDAKLVRTDVPCCAAKSCPLVVNDGDLLAGFSNFTTLSHLTLSVRGISSSCRVRIWCGKTRMAGLLSDEGGTMIDSVVWAQYINVRDTQPHNVTDGQTYITQSRLSVRVA